MSEKAVSTGNEQLMAEPRNLGCTFTSSNFPHEKHELFP